MNATCPTITEQAMAACTADSPTEPLDARLDRTDNFLYQAATVLAILLFLVSF